MLPIFQFVFRWPRNGGAQAEISAEISAARWHRKADVAADALTPTPMEHTFHPLHLARARVPPAPRVSRNCRRAARARGPVDADGAQMLMRAVGICGHKHCIIWARQTKPSRFWIVACAFRAIRY
jgi:hypothetical protein